MNCKNIILCGFMGCGKSTVGRALATHLAADYVDVDTFIEASAVMSIPALFAQQGEAHFRELESAAFAQICTCRHRVIATGGGLFLRTQNVAAAKENGVLLFLDSSFEDCYQRICFSDRPLVRTHSKEALHAIFQQRLPLYRSICNFSIQNNGTQEDALRAILALPF